MSDASASPYMLGRQWSGSWVIWRIDRPLLPRRGSTWIYKDTCERTARLVLRDLNRAKQ